MEANGIILSGGGIGLNNELALAALKTSAYKYFSHLPELV